MRFKGEDLIPQDDQDIAWVYRSIEENPEGLKPTDQRTVAENLSTFMVKR